MKRMICALCLVAHLSALLAADFNADGINYKI